MMHGGMMSCRDIIIIEFPFSDLMQSKKRPVLVLGEKGQDLIVCAITSNPQVDGVKITFETGSLPFESTIKYWQIQTILKSRATKKIARVSSISFNNTIKRINELFGQ